MSEIIEFWWVFGVLEEVLVERSKSQFRGRKSIFRGFGRPQTKISRSRTVPERKTRQKKPFSPLYARVQDFKKEAQFGVFRVCFGWFFWDFGCQNHELSLYLVFFWDFGIFRCFGVPGQNLVLERKTRQKRRFSPLYARVQDFHKRSQFGVFRVCFRSFFEISGPGPESQFRGQKLDYFVFRGVQNEISRSQTGLERKTRQKRRFSPLYARVQDFHKRSQFGVFRVCFGCVFGVSGEISAWFRGLRRVFAFSRRYPWLVAHLRNITVWTGLRRVIVIII